jgi:ATP/maltotriose-dependent transcriptional regulator MalT
VAQGQENVATRSLDREMPRPLFDGRGVDLAELLVHLDRVVRLVTEQQAALDRPSSAPVGGAPRGGLVEPLTDRELAVLQRLPSSLSTAEIAKVSYVSLNTVKSQVRSVYRKLGVNSRHEAVERARHLGLL